jgi:hypothetical protein
MQLQESGGEGGIRTPGRSFSPYNGLANRRLQPLGHLSGVYFQQFTIDWQKAAGQLLATTQFLQGRLHPAHRFRYSRIENFESASKSWVLSKTGNI